MIHFRDGAFFRMACGLLQLIGAIGYLLPLGDVSALESDRTTRGSESAAASHWAFRPIAHPRMPAVRDVAWPKSPIDRFILAKLEEQHLEPSLPAPRQTLIRRAAFGLMGLPPTPEEIHAFESDPAPDDQAFARVVDRMLASPRYGERWARHWLDVARYADNKGYVFFEEKTYPWAWTYRDYVVRAFNEDKPYGRFILEQLVADQLEPGPDPRSLAALGFLTVGDHFSNNIHDIIDDRIDVTTRGILGLTVGCARCHDHKHDPIKSTDYYGLYAIFRSTQEPMAPPVIDQPRLNEADECYELELIRREGLLREFVEAKHDDIKRGALSRIAEYLMAVHAQRDHPPSENFMLISDKGDLNPAVIHRWRSYLERQDPGHPVWGLWHAFARLDETNFPPQAALILKLRVGRTSDGEAANDPSQGGLEPSAINPLIKEAFLRNPPKSMTNVAALYAAALQQIAEKRDQASQAAGNRALTPAEQELEAILRGPDAPPDVPKQLDWGFLSLLPDRASQAEFQKLISSVEQWLMNQAEAPPRAMVLRDLPTPYEARVFVRGNPNRPGEPAPRRFIRFLDPSERRFSKGSGRLELAQALAHPANPLTARVFVNRLWLHHFGSGLVSTPSDFGLRGAPPTHPELLDWLAHEFLQSGGGIKRLHRLILTSAAYLQSSAADSNSIAVDPENKLLSRFPLQRHSFEIQRDALLAVSGKLDLRLGGPPSDPKSNRRSVYAFVNRMDVPPEMTTFDFPNPSTSCPQRSSTTVAPQALYMMNNEFVFQCAMALVDQSGSAEAGGFIERLRDVFLRVLGRLPSDQDLSNAQSFFGADLSKERWQRYVHALFLTNEFGFTD